MKLYAIPFLALALAVFSGCSKDDDSGSKGDQPSGPPVLDEGRTCLQFDIDGTTWYAHTFNGTVTGDDLSIQAADDKNQTFELSLSKLPGGITTIPVGANAGFLKFTNTTGELFDTQIGGAGNVLIDRWDKERVECRFLFPAVQSLGNNFVELANGKFRFDLPVNVNLEVENLKGPFESYVFIDRPFMRVNGYSDYFSGPESDYDLEVTTTTGGKLAADKINFDGQAGTNFYFDLDFSGFNRVVSNEKLKVELRRKGSIVDMKEQTFDVLPVFGTYRLQALSGAQPSNATITISPLTNPNRPNDAYEISGLTNQTLTFVIESPSGTIENYDSFTFNGSPVNNIYIYDDNATTLHIAIHNGNANFYELIRQ